MCRSLSDLRFPLLRSWQKPRFLPAETKLMSEKAPQTTFSNEPRSLSDLRFPLLRSWQKPRFLSAETKLMSEKAPQATFSNEQGSRSYAAGCHSASTRPWQQMIESRAAWVMSQRSGGCSMVRYPLVLTASMVAMAALTLSPAYPKSPDAISAAIADASRPDTDKQRDAN